MHEGNPLDKKMRDTLHVAIRKIVAVRMLMHVVLAASRAWFLLASHSHQEEEGNLQGLTVSKEALAVLSDAIFSYSGTSLAQGSHERVFYDGSAHYHRAQGLMAQDLEHFSRHRGKRKVVNCDEYGSTTSRQIMALEP